jgi:hypothetical protein
MGSAHIREFLGPIREIVALLDTMSSIYLRPADYDES